MKLNEVTLQLFNQNIIVAFVPDSPSHKRHAESIIGKLVGRNWEGNNVVSILLRRGERELLIPAGDIETIEAL